MELIAPFRQLHRDPYTAVSGGWLYWMQDAYTTRAWLSYDQPEPDGGDLNYIRNSVKVVIDAYNGTDNFYVTHPADPLVATYRRIFPSLFKPFAAMLPIFKSNPLPRGPVLNSGAPIPRLPHGRA